MVNEELEVKEKIEEIENKEIQEATKETENKENTTEENTNQKEKAKPNAFTKALKVVRVTIETIIWSLIVILAVLLVMTTASRKTDIFGYRLYVILSGSMEPTIHVKQAIVTKQIDDPQVGDIIAFGKDDFITVHRVIKVYTEGDAKLYQTKGDNNNAEDNELVRKEYIKGKVQYILPGVGEAVLYLQKHIIVLILAIGVLIMIIIIRRLIF